MRFLVFTKGISPDIQKTNRFRVFSERKGPSHVGKRNKSMFFRTRFFRGCFLFPAQGIGGVPEKRVVMMSVY